MANAGQDARAIQNMVRYTELSRPVQKFRALTANPRASQQLMGQSPICYCLKANLEVPPRNSRDLVLVPYTGVPGRTVMIQRKEIVASLLPAPR